jgi:hypothetical protein
MKTEDNGMVHVAEMTQDEQVTADVATETEQEQD